MKRLKSQKILPPLSLSELLDRATALAGRSLEEIATEIEFTLPANFQQNKGWQGQLLELILGTTAGCRPEPDFMHLGVELKTIPVNHRGKPLESTYVSMVPLSQHTNLTFIDSEITRKLSCVLWIPIAAEKHIAIPERRIGMPLLWRPSQTEWQLLQADWEELMQMIIIGQLDKITARMGDCLQIRPKALDGQSLCYSYNSDGERNLTLPRGFYLRPSFTHQILCNQYHQSH